ncbi:hypothetical protein ACHQM5_024463 [Ranunculus cassubicifolius]
MKDEDYFHNLPHNELQHLCRKHGLPAYKTKPLLAKMLVSWYQRKTTSSTMLEKLNVESEFHPKWETNKGKVTVRASDVEHRWSPSCSKEIPVPTMNVVLRPSFNSDSAEINRCSSFEAQQVSGGSLFGSKCDDIGPKWKNKSTSDFVKKGDYNQKLVDLARIDRSGNVPQSQCSNKNPCDVSTYSRFIPSHRVDKKLLPSFEFYVRSEEGINLCVDLDSTPLDWMKSLNDGVHIHSDVPNNKPWALHRDVKCLGGFDEEEVPSLDNKMNILEPDTIDSSMGSTVRETNNVKDVQLSTADRSPRSSAVTQSKTPLEISILQQEKNKRNPSLRGPNFDICTPMNMCIKSSPRSSKKGVQASDVRSAKQDIILSLGLDDQTKGEKSKMCFVGTSTHNVSLPLFGEVLQTSEPYSEQLHSFSTNCNSGEMQLSEVAHICEDMSNSPGQNGRAPDSDNPMYNLQNEIERSATCELDLNKSLDALPEFPEERQRSDLTNEAETSECCQFEVKAKKYKQSNSTDSEGIQNKRQRRQVEDSNYPAIKNLRNLRDKTRRQRLPRRSMRLVPK